MAGIKVYSGGTVSTLTPTPLPSRERGYIPEAGGVYSLSLEGRGPG
ncbi:hypothetical protein GCM10007071_29600 [Marinobacter zhanjiangensis]|uniref:Uncharacterized protein n=1 Tax=Marinobacter zhanjiangensis TaxID=578215 RepID=A0ABQ3B5A3_9GAMM|nr:hypothetical protein GCM10007071_29600 [Marinobacter zhanjiangensis]